MKMAGIAQYKMKDGGLGTRIWFVHPHTGKRPTIRLGKVNKEQAATFKGMVERLVKNNKTGTPDPVSVTWLAGLPEVTD